MRVQLALNVSDLDEAIDFYSRMFATEQPRKLDSAAAQDSDVIVTMGCGDACPVYPGKRYEDWDLTDPAGQPLDVVRHVRDGIEARVRALMASLGVPARR